MANAEATLENVYKEHWARLLAVLVRVFGPRNLELAEDVLQEAFGRALVAWQEQGVPQNPAGWILTAAKRQAIDTVRSLRTRRKFAADLTHHLESDWTLTHTVEREFEETQIRDHQLRMIFMCTDADLAPENRIPLILRTLCGFGIPAIARALLIPEATVKKRLVRTRERLDGHVFGFPTEERLPQVMDSVHTVLYLLFNEGFHSSEANRAMNLELCREAIHLGSLLIEEPRVVNRDTLGLMALMHFHLARAPSRLDAEGNNIPIDRQERSLWDRAGIEQGRRLLELGRVVVPGAGRFFIEAKIAEQHCIAARFVDTDWSGIVGWYDALVEATRSPLAELNRAVAIGYAGNPTRAIESIAELGKHDALRGSHLPSAVLAHLFAMAGESEKARAHAAASSKLGGTPREQRLLFEQIERLLSRSHEGR